MNFSGSEKRSSRDLKRPLKDHELEELINMLDESEVSEDEPFSSDNSVSEKNYDPTNDAEDSDSTNYESDSEPDANPANSRDPLLGTNLPQPITDLDDEWVDVEEDPKIYPPPKESININLPDDATALDYFCLLFDNSIFEIMVRETNKRAHDFFANQPVSTRKKKKPQWQDISIDEMKKFIGLCCLSGNIRFPSLARQWSKNALYYHPIFGRTMSRNRFTDILRMLRFVDHSHPDPNDRLFKIRPILEKIVHNIKSLYSPGQHLSIDEAMILWRGRLSFRQYIPNKRHKYGIKLYELTTDTGYILNIIVYIGKGTLVDEKESHAAAVVKELLGDYLQKGHILYVDNFYTSVSLAEFLLDNETGMVGTLRENRKGNPKKLLKRKLKKGEAIWNRKGKVVVTKWKDKRDVRMLSTCHKHEMVKITNKRGCEKYKPKCVLEYNAHMSGVDRADQMMSYYSSPRKTIKWYRKLFFHLVDICMWNACFIYKKKCQSKKTLLEFRDEVLMNILTPKPITPVVIDFQAHHFPAENTGEKNTMKRCRWCSKQNVRKRSKYHCPQCEEKPGLCIVPCFKEWHLNINKK